jgi:hypothetical protein
MYLNLENTILHDIMKYSKLLLPLCVSHRNSKRLNLLLLPPQLTSF